MPTDREVLEFVRKARETIAAFKAKGVEPYTELDGQRFSLFDKDTMDLLDDLEAMAKWNLGLAKKPKRLKSIDLRALRAFTPKAP
jgi:hypothetical protein